MSDSVRPHRQRPTRLPHPWDSPGKNTGVGCHFLLQCMKVKSESEVAQSCPTPSDMDCSPPGASIHGIFQARVLEWVAIAFSDKFYDLSIHSASIYWAPACVLSCSVVFNSSQPHGLQPTRLLCPGDSPGKSTGVHNHSFLQGIFSTQWSKAGVLHCRWTLCHLSHQGSPAEHLTYICYT